ncbi:hypothetical protein CYY_001937 [Polysphondylium violaceum]|uniref:Thioester reductase (TE) domain-containing protein n=1 Tax=Polysphondylium violaceum TaxID=133409 RepID=A0A8J4PYX3_9MYCE|nr:hypothetical protein CYY_001937 [Polysphondylium violaceum]
MTSFSLLQKKTIEYWYNETLLEDNFPTPNNKFLSSQFKNILIIGSNTLLNFYLLKQLLKRDDCESIYILNKFTIDEQQEKQNIFQAIESLTGAEISKDDREKLKLLNSDLKNGQKMFGLSKHIYENLSSTIDIIINSGSIVDFSLSYELSKIENVNGIKQVLKFSNSNPNYLMKIVHLSSISLFFNNEKVLEEKDLPELGLLNGKYGYYQSKTISEYILKEASSRGYKILLIRVPTLISIEKGVVDEFDLFISLLKKSLSNGIFPDMAHFENYNVVQVEWFSRVLFKLITDNSLVIQENLNIFNPSHFTQIRPIVHTISKEFNIPTINMDDWISHIGLSKDISIKNKAAIVNFFCKQKKFISPMSIKTWNYLVGINEHSNINIDYNSFLKFLNIDLNYKKNSLL